MKFTIKDFFSKCDQKPQEHADLVTFTKEILNGKLHFLCIVTDHFLAIFCPSFQNLPPYTKAIVFSQENLIPLNTVVADVAVPK